MPDLLLDPATSAPRVAATTQHLLTCAGCGAPAAVHVTGSELERFVCLNECAPSPFDDADVLALVVDSVEEPLVA